MKTALVKKNKTSPMAKTFEYHEFEFCICGYSGSGKTTLLEKLIQKFSEQYCVGYTKSDAHQFQMDKSGKDTFRASKNGASGTLVFDPLHWATIQNGSLPEVLKKQIYYSKDFVLVEGRKKSPLPKAVLIDEAGQIFEKIESGEINNIQAYIGPWQTPPSHLNVEPYFCRDDVEGIAMFILNFFKFKKQAQPLFGLVLSGGKSQRMNKDKALLEYQGKPQILRAIELLKPYCDQVFQSHRQGQLKRQGLSDCLSIYDTFIGYGPMGGILSAMKQYPQANWLVLACDLPYLTASTIKELLKKRDIFKIATAYKSANDSLPEPLCAIYEGRAIYQLLTYLGLGYHCPRKVLIQSKINLLDPIDPMALENVNYPSEYESAKSQIEKRGVFHE